MTADERCGSWYRGGVLAGVLTATLAASPAAARPFTGAAALVRVYDAILDADFTKAETLLEDTCPPAPEEACLVLDATQLLWQIQLDPEQTRHDTAFSERVARAIDAAEAWVSREPDDAEAWFYLGGAYGARVQWRVLRQQQLAAARDGKRIKQAMEQALRLDQTLEDAQFGLGLYEYYAAVAPAAARMFRWLLFLPGGDRETGLARMQRTQQRGILLGGEAGYQLHLIYLWYEKRPQDALGLLRRLSGKYPGNPLFLRLIGDTEDAYLHDRAASLSTYRTLLDRARTKRVHEPALAETDARLRIARVLDALGDTDLAIAELTALVDADPQAPYLASLDARLALASADARTGDWTRAEALFREVIARAPSGDPHGLAALARRGLSRKPDETKARAYGASLQAWRRFEKSGPDADVEEALERALTSDPQNAMIRYRYGRVLAARVPSGSTSPQAQEAVRLIEDALQSNGLPPTMAADAALAAGRLREQLHEPARAIEHYRRAANLFGGAADTRAAAARALARLQRDPAPRGRLD